VRLRAHEFSMGGSCVTAPRDDQFSLTWEPPEPIAVSDEDRVASWLAGRVTRQAAAFVLGEIGNFPAWHQARGGTELRCCIRTIRGLR